MKGRHTFYNFTETLASGDSSVTGTAIDPRGFRKVYCTIISGATGTLYMQIVHPNGTNFVDVTLQATAAANDGGAAIASTQVAHLNAEIPATASLRFKFVGSAGTFGANSSMTIRFQADN